MLKIENTSVIGLKETIRGMRSAMNSWAQIDSKCDGCGIADGHSAGDNDLEIMRSLVKAGTDRRKFMQMIDVTCDIIAPCYFFEEFDTYKVYAGYNSCSTMHKIHAKEFTSDDFSNEYLCDVWLNDFYCLLWSLNEARNKYLKTNDKRYWWQMIQLLPSSYNQRRAVQLDYQVLQNIYHARRNHKLDEWRTFCEWIETLPCSELITGKDES